MPILECFLIGDRINPGFRSTRALIDREDIDGLCALARRQVQCGADCLDLTIGARGYDDPAFLAEVIRAVQREVDVPLCFDYPSAAVQEVCLRAYDAGRARGRNPIVNSIAETRLDMLELGRIRPFDVVIMTSELVEDGAARPARNSDDVLAVAGRLHDRIARRLDLRPQQIFIDITVNSLAADTRGLTAAALDAIGRIRRDGAMAGAHIMGGLTNIGNLLPPVEIEGVRLGLAMENAFLTEAIPRGLDTIMGTPWNPFQLLRNDHPTLRAFREVSALTGLDATRRLRRLWAK
jgi:cobalamin-dependent methionine synthase I